MVYYEEDKILLSLVSCSNSKLSLFMKKTETSKQVKAEWRRGSAQGP